MEIVTDLEWDSIDEANWRTFLATKTGSRLIPKLLEFTPPLLERGHVNQILIASGKVIGFSIAARELLALSQPKPAPTKDPSEYPALNDDAAWNDGQKLTE